jgi:hypothetical protein
MSKQQVIRVGTTKEKAVQSKAQKEFNRLTKKIEKTEKDIKEFRDVASKLQQRVGKEMTPLINQLVQLQAQIVKIYDRAYDNKDVKKAEKKKLAHLIREIAFELIDQDGMEELKAIYDKYDEQGYDAASEEMEQSQLDMVKQMASQMLGIDLSDVDLKDPEKVQAFLHQKLIEKEAAEEEQQRIAAERRAKKPKTDKQKALEAKREEETRNITKSVRTLYMDLVKAFHPDREPDEAEKTRKTEIMQRVTQAYEASDLLALLRLQLEFNRIDQDHLETLADDQLKYYNKILKDQAQDLDGELYAIQQQMGQMSGSMFGIQSTMQLEYRFNNDVRQMKKQIKTLKSDIELFSDLSTLKLWLREYKIPRPDQHSYFDFM